MLLRALMDGAYAGGKPSANARQSLILLSFLVTVKAAPHECVNRTGLL